MADLVLRQRSYLPTTVYLRPVGYRGMLGQSIPAFVQEVAGGGSAGAVTSLILTLGAVTTTAGNHLLMQVATTGPTFLPTSVVDSKGNTWQRDTQVSDPQVSATTYSARITTPLVAADTVTITLGLSGGVSASIIEVSGLAATNWLDVAQTYRSGLPNTTPGGQMVSVSNRGETGSLTPTGAVRFLYSGIVPSTSVSGGTYTLEVQVPPWTEGVSYVSTSQVATTRVAWKVVAEVDDYYSRASWVTNRTNVGHIAAYIPLPVSAALQAQIDAASSMVPVPLDTLIKMAAEIDGVSALTAALTTPILLAAQIDGVSALTAALTTSIKLAAEIDGVSGGSAALTNLIKMTAEIDGVSNLSAALTNLIKMAAEIDGVSGGSATLTALTKMAAEIDGVSGLTATLTSAGIGAALAAEVDAVSALTAALTTVIKMAAEPDAVSTLSAALTTLIKMQAEVDAVSGGSASLTNLIQMSASIPAVSGLSADLTAGGHLLAAQIDALSSASASMTTAIPLSATVSAISLLVADLSGGDVFVAPVARDENEGGASPLHLRQWYDDYTLEMDDAAALFLLLD